MGLAPRDGNPKGSPYRRVRRGTAGSLKPEACRPIRSQLTRSPAMDRDPPAFAARATAGRLPAIASPATSRTAPAGGAS